MFLLVLLGITAGAWIFCSARCSRCRCSLRKLASCRKMQYSRHDPFNLARRVETHWPIPECSQWRVVDVVYGSVGSEHRYIFTVEFTLGPLDYYRRDARVAAFSEPRECAAAERVTVEVAEESGSIVSQYERLMGAS